jgi:RimJ/RimL family protein N-acetyltransferase
MQIKDIEHLETERMIARRLELSDFQDLGRGGLRHVPIEGKDEVEIGYAVMPIFWRQGYATEMGRAAIQVAVNNLHLKELVCFTFSM